MQKKPTKDDLPQRVLQITQISLGVHYADAEPLLARAIAIYEKAHGAEHPNVANLLERAAAEA